MPSAAFAGDHRTDAPSTVETTTAAGASATLCEAAAPQRAETGSDSPVLSAQSSPYCVTDSAGFTYSAQEAPPSAQKAEPSAQQAPSSAQKSGPTGAGALSVPVTIAGIVVVVTGAIMLLVRRRTYADQ